MSSAAINIKVHEHSGTIVIDRMERRNALSRNMVPTLQQAFSDLHQEKRVRAVILTGAGSTFCSGTDLEEIQDSAQSDDAQRLWHQDALALRGLLEDMLRFPKPIIAAVNGPALGVGAALVLAADLVVAAPSAQLGVPESRRGLVSGFVVPLLVFRTGGGLAARMCLTAEPIGSDEAVRQGLFHEIVDMDLIWARAHQLAGECAKSAPESLALTKRLLNETIGEQVSTWLSLGAAALATARTTEASIEGVSAFLERRDPEWK